MRKVAIFGGGIGGLSAAHELCKHGFEIDVYEASGTLGGKAKSQYLRGTGTEGRRDLPGEHGFRFYPHFYRQLIRTMAEIPDPLSPTGFVEGNLTGTRETGIGLGREELLIATANLVEGAKIIPQSGIHPKEFARYIYKHLVFALASEKRRLYDYDPLSWWNFVGADDDNHYSPEYREIIAATTRTMVAMDAKNGSARSVGHPSLMLIFAGRHRSKTLDRTMSGPTTECLIEPWQAHLEAQGVRFHFHQPLRKLQTHQRRISSAQLWDTQNEASIEVVADEYILATPLEVTHTLMTPPLRRLDPHLDQLARLEPEKNTDWMSGAQFYLREDVPICKGHVFFVNTPWGITSISQAQFWNLGERRMDRYGDGTVRGILSVDIANFWAEDRHGRRAADCTSADEILDSVWDQILLSVGAADRQRLRSALVHRHLDTNLRIDASGVHNTTPLFVHVPGRFMERPPASLAIPNLCLAADYVRNNMDLATMEGANEAARRASRAILARAGLSPELVHVGSYPLPAPIRALQRIDEKLFDGGLPHMLGGLRAWASALRRGPRSLDLARLAQVDSTLASLTASPLRVDSPRAREDLRVPVAAPRMPSNAAIPATENRRHPLEKVRSFREPSPEIGPS